MATAVALGTAGRSGDSIRQVEVRVDPSDGRAYNWEEFQTEYGKHAAARWSCAGRVAIFHATSSTEAECRRRCLFGSSRLPPATCRHLVPGCQLLLFNIETKVVTFPCTATSAPGKRIEPTAWGGRFQHQVRVSFEGARQFSSVNSKLLKILKRAGSLITLDELPPAWRPVHQLPIETFDDSASQPDSDAPSNPGSTTPSNLSEDDSLVQHCSKTSQSEVDTLLPGNSFDTASGQSGLYTFEHVNSCEQENAISGETKHMEALDGDSADGSVHDLTATMEPPSRRIANTNQHNMQGLNWQQQQIIKQASLHVCAQCCEKQAHGRKDDTDQKWYCEQCWHDFNIKAVQHVRLVYIRIAGGNWRKSIECERELTDRLSEYDITFEKQYVPDKYDLSQLVHSAWEKGGCECVCLISGRDGGKQMALFWPAAAKQEVEFYAGLRQICSRLSPVHGNEFDAHAGSEAIPVVSIERKAEMRGIIQKLAKMFREPKESQSNRAAQRIPSEFGGSFAALMCEEEEDDDDSPQSPAAASAEVCEDGDDHYSRAEFKASIKAAAKLVSSYIYKDLADDNHDGACENADSGEAWHRSGRRTDPLIPTEVWPALKQHLSAELTKWWGCPQPDEVVDEQAEQLLDWCRKAAERVSEVVQKHPLPSCWDSALAGIYEMPVDCDTIELVYATNKIELMQAKNAARVCISRGKYEQLRDRYSAVRKTRPGMTMEQFPARVFNLLLRYETLAQFDQGTQGTCPKAAFEVMSNEWGVSHECFASPLNATLTSFNSCCPDVDGSFGSLGSFYDWFPTHGAYEANPPFDFDSVNLCFRHIDKILQLSQSSDYEMPLLFVVITPFVPAHVSPKFVLGRFSLDQNRHCFRLGMHHRGGAKKQDWWICPKPTCVTFVGNKAAAVKWPVTNVTFRKLREAFLPP